MPEEHKTLTEETRITTVADLAAALIGLANGIDKTQTDLSQGADGAMTLADLKTLLTAGLAATSGFTVTGSIVNGLGSGGIVLNDFRNRGVGFHDGDVVIWDGSTQMANFNPDMNLFNRPVSFNHATVKFTGLPITDPGVNGQAWNDNGALKISAG